MDRRAEGVQRLLKTAGPTLVGVFCVLLVSLPVRPFGGYAPMPVLPLIAIFFWTVQAPAQLPSPSVFLIGLLHDFLSGGPLGLWPAVYLCVQYVVLTQRAYFVGREIQVLWVGFAVAALMASLMIWLVTSLLNGRVLSIAPLLMIMFATVLVYPLFAALFGAAHRRAFRE
jgi:rod shape-determining protein MreD